MQGKLLFQHKTYKFNDKIINFLFAYQIYFSGFSLSEEEKLKRIVISTGGIRYAELNESITHILVGDFSLSLANLLHSIQEK